MIDNAATVGKSLRFLLPANATPDEEEEEGGEVRDEWREAQ